MKGIIYMHRISDFRMGGIARRNFSMFRKLCGDETLESVAIVTNMWGEVDFDRGVARERELASDTILFRPILEGGAQMLRNDTSSRQSAHRIIQFFLNKPRQTLRIQRELVDEGRDIADTSAGVELDRELAAVQRKHKEELKEIQKEMEEAMRMKDDQTRRELEQVRRQLENDMNRVENDRQRLSAEYEEEKRKMDSAMKDLERKLQAEAARHEEREIQLRSLQAQYEHAAHVSQAEREQLAQQIGELEKKKKKGNGGVWGKLFGAVGAACAVLVSIHTGGAAAGAAALAVPFFAGN